jgi:hypothetical protein
LSVSSYSIFEPHQRIPISHTPSILALDGERELSIRKDDRLTIRVNPQGPRVIDIDKTLRLASEQGLFIKEQP